MKAVQELGICSEKLWPYDITKFSIKPSTFCYQDATHRTITSYHFLNTLNDVLQIINSNKPVVIGLTVYKSFNDVSSEDPVIHLPKNYDSLDGGSHAMSVVGYDLNKQQLLVKNSFGTNWGDRGYAWLPFDYVDAGVFGKWTFNISAQPPV